MSRTPDDLIAIRQEDRTRTHEVRGNDGVTRTYLKPDHVRVYGRSGRAMNWHRREDNLYEATGANARRWHALSLDALLMHYEVVDFLEPPVETTKDVR